MSSVDAVIPEPTPEARKKLERLRAVLHGYGSCLVAYSGGVDSTFLAAVSGQVLGEKALAVTADSLSLAPEELVEATDYARQFGFRHLVVKTQELDNPDYAKNPINRCYFCKAELMDKLLPVAQEHRIERIALGAIMDDLGDVRPGEQASAERGAVFPLREAEMTKAEIRMLSKEMGLPTADKPGGACLASRIPFGQEVTGEKLSQVAQAEAVLHGLGFAACRVRHHEKIARIEVPVPLLSDVLTQRETIVEALRALGFVYITVDLLGLRSGSLHEAAPNQP